MLTLFNRTVRQVGQAVSRVLPLSAENLNTVQDSNNLSYMDALIALAPGDKNIGMRLLNTYEKTHSFRNYQSLPSDLKYRPDQNDQTNDHHASLHIPSDSFSWLADIAASQIENPNSNANALVKNLLEKYARPINILSDPIAPCRSLQETYDTLLRIVRIWSYYHLFKQGKNYRTIDLALQISMRDIIALERSLSKQDPPSPTFARINIYMVLSIFEQLIAGQSQSRHDLDPFLSDLSLHYARVIKQSKRRDFEAFIHHIRSKNNLRLQNLSYALGSCFDEQYGTANFSQDPIIHAHLFIWLYATNKIISYYLTVHHTLQVRLQQLCSLLAEFCSCGYTDKNLKKTDLAFLSLRQFSSSPYNIKSIFPPPPDTLLTFIKATRTDFPSENSIAHASTPLNVLDFELLQTPHLHLQICLPAKNNDSQVMSENYLLNPLSLVVSAKKSSRHKTNQLHTESQYPIFGQPSIPISPQSPYPFLQYTGIGFGDKNSNAFQLHGDILPIPVNPLQKEQLQRIIENYLPLSLTLKNYPSLSLTRGFNSCIAALQLKSQEVSVIRHILVSKKHNIILGIDKVISLSPMPRQRDLSAHISFFCPRNCLVRTVQNDKVAVIKQLNNKHKHIWQLEMLPHANPTPSWGNTHHPDGGHWIFHRISDMTSGQYEIAWLLSSDRQRIRGQGPRAKYLWENGPTPNEPTR